MRARSKRGSGKIAIRTAWERRRELPDLSLNGTIEAALVEPERDPVLAEALRTLPAKRRLIVFLRYFADLSYGEIASICEVSEGTVGATLSQARAALEELLQKEDARGHR